MSAARGGERSGSISPLLQTAVRHLEHDGLAELTRVVSRETTHELLLDLARAVGGEEDALRLAEYGPEALALIRQLERLLFASTVKEWSVPGRTPSPPEMLGILAGFSRVRERLSEAAPATDTPVLHTAVLDLAHDLRSPLTSILFLVETLRRGQSGPVGDLQYRQLGIVYSAALSLVSLVNDVIEFARPVDHGVERSPSAFSLRALLDSICDLVEPLVADRGLDLRVKTPAVDRRQGYPVTLSRVLLNLTTNALKYTEQGMVEIVAREAAGDRVVFSVRDTGPGMEPESTARIFEPFRRGTLDDSPAFDGYGLGLTICRRLLGRMGSDLTLETSPGWGTCFYFELSLPPAEG